MFFTYSLKYDLVLVSVAFLAVMIAYCKWAFTYWKNRGLAVPNPVIPFGNNTDFFLLRKTFGEVCQDIYFHHKSKGLRHGGAYFLTKPVYIPVDLDIVKNVLQSDFQHFLGHGVYVNEATDPLSVNVFNLDGPKWKDARTKLTPTFTSGKMKMMFQTLVECADGLRQLLEREAQTGKPIDMKDIMGRFTTDVIGSCAFGIDCNSMKNPESKFRRFGLKAIDLDIKGTARQFAQVIVPHKVLEYFNYSANDSEISDFFLNLVQKTIEYRERNGILRKDFMHLLIQLKNKGTINEDNEKINVNESKTVDGSMTVNEIAAQSFVFFLAGFETSSTTINFASYELSVNRDVQDKLRKEINTVLERHANKLTYDAVMEMTYLDKVIYETLRKYPPLPELFRVCNKDYRVPGTDVVIEKGTNTFIPILGIHRDPDYYPDPDRFDPERFSEENKAKRPQFAWLPFGEGPRVCIGLRFGMMQTKVGLITLLKNFEISLNKKTRTPMVFSKRGVILSMEGGCWIDIQKLN